MIMKIPLAGAITDRAKFTVAVRDMIIPHMLSSSQIFPIVFNPPTVLCMTSELISIRCLDEITGNMIGTLQRENSLHSQSYLDLSLN